jgi:PAS domain S-box-containing protein
MDKNTPIPRASRELLAAIVDSSDDAIISKNLEGVMTSWNRGAQRIFGYTAEEAIGRPVTMLSPAERQNEEVKILSEIQQGRRVEHFETIRQRKDGQLLNVSLTISPVKDESGRIVGASKIARNITDQKKAERMLQQMQEQLQLHAHEMERRVQERTVQLERTVAELEAFSYSLSHDMRAPLRSIESFSQILVEDYGSTMEQPALDLLNRVVSAARRMDRLILDLLTFTRLSREPVVIETVDVEKLVREILPERADFQPSQADITIEGTLPRVMGNEASLTQCITNFLSNAVKFVAPQVKPRVRIYAEQSNGTVRLWFEDNGIGIELGAQGRLFRMFERLHGGAYPGTGLGLAIVRRAVERMNGEVGVESQAGRGSRFWVELPGALR